MALASATTAAAAAAASSPSRLFRRFSSSAPPPSLLPLAARPGAGSSPRACSYHRFVVRWKGRARALLGGFSDAGGSESDDDEEDALRRGQREGEGEDAVEPAAAAAGPERWDVLGLGQAMVRASSSPSFFASSNCFLLPVYGIISSRYCWRQLAGRK